MKFPLDHQKTFMLCLLGVALAQSPLAAQTSTKAPTLGSSENAKDQIYTLQQDQEAQADARTDFQSETSFPSYLYSTPFYVERGTAEEREKFKTESIDHNIEKYLSMEFAADEETEDKWGGAYWTAGILNYDSPTVRTSINKAFEQFAQLTPNFQRIILQSTYTLYPDQYIPEVEASLPFAAQPKAFAIGAYHLLRASPTPTQRAIISTLLENRFPETDAPQLIALKEVLKHPLQQEIRSQPPMIDLLTAPIVEGKPVIFSLQRLNRNYPGIAIVRGTDGKFLRNTEGGIFHLSQHARSRTDLPGTITYGNSPRGIYSINGSGIATNKFIGSVPYLWSRVPVEVNPSDYFFGEIPEALQPFLVIPEKPEEPLGWSRELYTALLPNSWKTYRPIYEAWLAGQAGRSDMIIHGTTINPDFYKNEIYYPHTPSAGCIGAIEFWSPEDGSLLYSGQLELLKQFTSTKTDKGFLVVVDLDAKDHPVRLDDVLPMILEAERLMRENHSAEDHEEAAEANSASAPAETMPTQ